MADTSKITLKQLKDAMNKAKNYTDNEIAGITGVSKVEPEELDMPKVFFYGTALPTTKDNVNLTMDYISNTAKFSSFVKLKCQGTSSMSYAKKNFTVSMFSDESRTIKLKKDFKGWGAQSKFCLKANYVDTTHTRNISGARIAYDMVKSRPDSPFKQELLQCPRNGAVDGFPIKVYFNGEFYGIYTWNIPKDGWMFNMDESNPKHTVLCAERNTDGNSSLINSCQFRKLWTDGDGGDWSVEFGTYSTDMVASLNRCINFVMTATDQEFHDNIGDYFDLYSLLDYYCFSYLCCHLDGLAKNMLMATYDGVIWGACLYDMDSTYGVHWNGNSYVATNYQCPEQYQEQFSGLWPRIESCFATELYARYLELRRGALSLSNIIKHVEEIYDVIPDRVFADEKAKWTSLPQVNTNTMTRFRNYMRDRAVYVDAQMEEIGTRVPCTGIVLSADTLSFTTTDTQTLSVVVNPDNTTDIVTWSVSPSGVVTVVDGLVTPVANGACTITATCGSYSDTCTVNVALPVVECTSISLDRDTLSLPGSGGSSNLLTGIPNSIVSKNVIFDAITLQPGIYKFANIDGGSFTYLGYTINSGAKQEPNGNSTNPILFELTETSSVVLNAFPNNVATNTSEKLGLYKTTEGQRFALTATGDGYYQTASTVSPSANDKYVDNITLDATKCYVLKYTGTPTLPRRDVCLVINNTLSTSAVDINTGDTVKLISNASSMKLSCNISRGNTLDDLVLYEAEALDTETTSSYQLAATVTPENCTQPVVWSVSPEGIVTVDNGLVTAVANGEATVTATCGSKSATCAVTVSGMSESGVNPNLVFQVNSASMNTVDNTLTDNIARIGATLTGNPTVSDNQIAFTANDKFSFDLSSLSLNTSNRTLRVKFTPTSLNTNVNNVFVFGETTNAWNSATTVYVSDSKLIMQHGSNNFSNTTVGNVNGGDNNNRLSGTPTINTEYEIVISENALTNEVRWFINGTLVQNGISTLLNPLYLSNIEGTARFVGNYSLIEIYNGYCDDYTEFTNMVNNTSSGGGTDIYETAEYAITEARTFNGTSDYIDTGLKLFDTAKTFTIFVDYTSTTASETAAVLFHCVHEASPYRGLCMMKLDNSDKYFIGGQASGQNNYDANLPATGKYIISFVNGVINNVATVNDLGELVYSATDMASNNPYVQISENLLIGCYQNTSGTKGRYWSGTINKFGLWFKQLTENEINTLLNPSLIPSNLLEGITWSANADNGIYNNSQEGTVGVEKGSGNGDAYLSGQIPCGKKKYVLSNINGATFIYKEIYVYASDGTFLGGHHGNGKYNANGQANNTTEPITMDLRNISEEPAYMKITVYPNNVATNNDPANQLKLMAFD